MGLFDAIREKGEDARFWRHASRLYTPAELAALKQIDANPKMAQSIIEASVSLGPDDVVWAITRGDRIPAWLFDPALVTLARQANAALTAHSEHGDQAAFDFAEGIFSDESNPLTLHGVVFAGRHGLLARPPAPQPVTAPAPPPGDPHWIELPDGTDLGDPVLRRRVEDRVRQARGPSWVVMWQRDHPDVVDGVRPRVPIVNARPDAVIQELDPGVKPTDAASLAAVGAQHGALVQVDWVRGEAVYAPLPPEAVRVRERLAALLRVPPWEVEVAIFEVVDPKTGLRRLDQVVTTRGPALSTSPEKRKEIWRDLLTVITDEPSGWRVDEDPLTSTVRLRFGLPRSLPALVSTADLLPDGYDPAGWKKLAVGVNPAGNTEFLDFNLGPHALLVGPSGTGKSVAALQICTSALVAGFDVAVVDVAKRGADFKKLLPWLKYRATTGPQAAAAMKYAYAESQRRADIIERYDADHWTGIPTDVREREGIRPLLLLVDEFQAFNEVEKIPAGIDKQSQEFAELQAINDDKIAVVTAARRIVAEARWAGVYIVICTQRAPSETIPVTMRDNLHWKFQLCAPNKAITPSTMGLTFPEDQKAEALEVQLELDDGVSRGLGLVGGDGGSVVGVRVGFADKPLIPGWLEERDVPLAEPWVLDVDAASAKPPSKYEVIDEAKTPVVDLSDVDFSDASDDVGSEGLAIEIVSGEEDEDLWS